MANDPEMKIEATATTRIFWLYQDGGWSLTEANLLQTAAPPAMAFGL